MNDLEFRRLPVNADEGFPQAFRLTVAGVTYRFALHVNVAEQEVPDPVRAPDGAIPGGAVPGGVLDLATDAPGSATGAFMVVVVVREDPGGDAPLLRRRIVPGLRYRAGDLVLTFRTLRVALRNLNGIGSFGSEVVGGVALR